MLNATDHSLNCIEHNEDVIFVSNQNRKELQIESPQYIHVQEEYDNSTNNIADYKSNSSENQSLENKKQFNCTICGRNCSSNSLLIQHMRIHTGEKPFKCEICGKSFNQKNHLVCHNRIHGDVRPFKCDNCEKRFNSKTNLIHHMRIHTGERPYECPKCDKKFIQKGGLAYHLSVEHK